jgi:hypothetical protein
LFPSASHSETAPPRQSPPFPDRVLALPSPTSLLASVLPSLSFVVVVLALPASVACIPLRHLWSSQRNQQISKADRYRQPTTDRQSGTPWIFRSTALITREQSRPSPRLKRAPTGTCSLSGRTYVPLCKTRRRILHQAPYFDRGIVRGLDHPLQHLSPEIL